MSSYSFECVVTEKLGEAEQFFLLLQDASWGRIPDSQRKIKDLLQKSNEYVLPLIKFNLSRSGNSLNFSFESAPSLGFDFFAAIARVLDDIEDIHYKANFFDSSSGGHYEWMRPEFKADSGC